MTIVKGYYDEIHFTESNINGFEFLDGDLIIDIESGLAIYGEHPLADSLKMSEPCRLIFKNVTSSQRDLDIYAGDPKKDGFKETKTIIDELNVPSHKLSQEYGVEGVLLKEPIAWIDWKITAEEFYLDDLKN